MAARSRTVIFKSATHLRRIFPYFPLEPSFRQVRKKVTMQRPGNRAGSQRRRTAGGLQKQ
jgi:hypothetical protein